MNTPATNRTAALELFAGDPDFMTSLAKGLIVLEALGSLSGVPTIANLSHATGLSRAAVRRCLYTLSKLGYARSAKDRQHERWSRMNVITTSKRSTEESHVFRGFTAPDTTKGRKTSASP